MIKEDFLHYLWNYKLFNLYNLKTIQKEEITIINSGTSNINSGPDFFNAKLIIGEQTWAGNVEIHVNSSDWYLHHHEKDSNYDNVILHVVWHNDAEIYQKNNTSIPTLELQKFTPHNLLTNYKKLFSKHLQYIHCENEISNIDAFTLDNWLEKLYIERLIKKSDLILELLAKTNNDWESVLFKLLAKNFGLKVNGEAFLNMVNSFDFSIFRKELHKLQNIEALLFGQAGLLQEDIQNSYFNVLKKEYQHLSLKYSLDTIYKGQFHFFRLRPSNFPTIRIAQLANLYYIHDNLFSKIISFKNINYFYKFFIVGTSTYWKTHYNFNSISKKSNKNLTKPFIDLLLINTIIPLLFVYYKQQGKLDEEKLFDLIKQIKPEKNSVIDKFFSLNIITKNALETQALLQLKNEYCDKHRCMQCAIGDSLLRESSI